MHSLHYGFSDLASRPISHSHWRVWYWNDPSSCYTLLFNCPPPKDLEEDRGMVLSIRLICSSVCPFICLSFLRGFQVSCHWEPCISDQLTHWGQMTHICVSKLTIIGSDNGLSPGRRQAIIWTNGEILLIRTLGTNFSEILSAICAFSFKKMHLKMSSAKWRPFCLGLNELTLVVLCCYKEA